MSLPGRDKAHATGCRRDEVSEFTQHPDSEKARCKSAGGPVIQQAPRRASTPWSPRRTLRLISLYIRFVNEAMGVGGLLPSRFNHHPKDQGDSTPNLRSSKAGTLPGKLESAGPAPPSLRLIVLTTLQDTEQLLQGLYRIGKVVEGPDVVRGVHGLKLVRR